MSSSMIVGHDASLRAVQGPAYLAATRVLPAEIAALLARLEGWPETRSGSQAGGAKRLAI